MTLRENPKPREVVAPEPRTLVLPGELPEELSVEVLKKRIDITGESNDEMLGDYLLAAYQQAQERPPLGCGRQLYPEPATAEDEPVEKTYKVRGRNVLLPDAREITKIVVIDDDASPEESEVELDDCETSEDHGLIVGLKLPRFQPKWWREQYPFYEHHHKRTVKVTGRFGFLVVPQELREGIYILAARMFYEREAQFADQVAVGEGATASLYYRQLPPRTRIAFESFAVAKSLGGLS